MDYEFIFNSQSPIQSDDNDIYFSQELIDCQFDQTENENFFNSNFDKIFEEKEKNDMIYMNHFFSIKDSSSNSEKNKKVYIYKKKQIVDTSKKYTKRKLSLSSNAQDFKNNYFLIFTNKKKFPKPIIRKIHQIIQEPLKLKPMSREIVRFNDKYFEEYVNDAFKIIQYLLVHKEEILISIPELSEIDQPSA